MTKDFNNPWKKLSEKLVYKNPWIHVYEDQVTRPDGTEGVYGRIETNGPVVVIIALTPDDEIYLVGQYRYLTNMFSWELPCGNSEGDDPLIAAKRELQEETGLVANEWEQIADGQSNNGMLTELMHIFVARDLTQTNENEQLEEGITQMKKIPFSEAIAMAKNREITDALALAGILHAALYLGKLN